MRRKYLYLWMVFLFLSVVSFSVMAKPSLKSRVKHADKNKDGVVDKKEIKLEKKWEHKQRVKARNKWRHKKMKVNNKFEKKYDSDSNGWLNPSETKVMLKAKYSLIKSNGKAKVNTAAEEEYDVNEDGILDVSEAKKLKEDLN